VPLTKEGETVPLKHERYIEVSTQTPSSRNEWDGNSPTLGEGAFLWAELLW